MTEPVILLEDVATRFDDKWVHDGLSLSIDRNRIVALVGPSGCGKTTLLREILLLQPIERGHIYLLGEQVSSGVLTDKQVRWFACRMGMMFQHGALFSDMTVLENVMFPLMEYSDFSRQAMQELAALKLRMVGLVPEAFSLMPSALSGGMRKRVALARALALDPEVLLLDEPSAGLDPKSAFELDQLILQLQESLGLTVVMVTHDLDTIWGIVDEVVYLGGGKVQIHDTVSVVAAKKQPQHLHDFFNSPRGIAAKQYYQDRRAFNAK